MRRQPGQLGDLLLALRALTSSGALWAAVQAEPSPLAAEGASTGRPPLASPPAGPLRTGKRHVRRILLVTAAFVLLASTGLEGYLLVRELTTHDVTGRLVFRGAALDAAPGSICEAPLFSFIVEGSPVVVYDDDGHVLGRTELGPGTAATDGACVYLFTIDNVGDADRYTFDVGSLDLHRRTVSRDELARNGWRIQFVAGTAS